MASHHSPLHDIPENKVPDSSESSNESQHTPQPPSSPTKPYDSPFARITPSDPGTTHPGQVHIDVKHELNGLSNNPHQPRLGRSSVNVASIVRRDSAALRKQQSRPLTPPLNLEKYCTTGRVYHPEHFHGHRQYPASLPGSPDPLKNAPSMQDGTFPDDIGRASMHFEAPNSERSSILHNRVDSGRIKGDDDRGTYTGSPPPGMVPPQPPMPKWPANWQSAAFEAVSQKRSYVLSPPEIYAEIAHHGCEKAKFSWYKLVMLSILAGAYVGFGYTTALMVGGLMEQAPSNPDQSAVNRGVFNALIGAMGFPFAFTIIVVCGAELYTSMCAYTAAAWWEGKLTILDALRMMFISYFGNFTGAAIMVGLMIAARTYEGKTGYLVYSAELKVSDGWGATLVKGILANWLVGIATWMANAAQDLTGKFVGIWLPISAFAAIGFEHCIANMFLIPLAIQYGADINARDFVAYNLIPSTIGNWIGGAMFVATSYAFVYGRTPPRIYAYFESKFQVHAYGAGNESQHRKEVGKEG